MLHENGLKLERNETRDPRTIPISLCINSVLGFNSVSLSVSVSLLYFVFLTLFFVHIHLR